MTKICALRNVIYNTKEILYVSIQSEHKASPSYRSCMILVVTANIAGQTRGEPVQLPDRRRCRFHDRRAPQAAGRRFIVSVHRKGETFLRPTDGSVRLRKKWSGALVRPDDVVRLTVVPGRALGRARRC